MLARVYTSSMRDARQGWISSDQQPIRRVVGRRIAPPPGKPPSAAIRAAMDANRRYRTRAPKGVLIYENHAQMIRDRERWTVEAIVQKQRERA